LALFLWPLRTMISSSIVASCWLAEHLVQRLAEQLSYELGKRPAASRVACGTSSRAASRTTSRLQAEQWKGGSLVTDFTIATVLYYLFVIVRPLCEGPAVGGPPRSPS
jgi:hypothetical protein